MKSETPQKIISKKISSFLLENFDKRTGAKKIENDFVSELFDEILKKKYKENKKNINKSVEKGIEEVFTSIYSEEEILKVFDFVKSEPGAKLLRNLDLFFEVYGKAMADFLPLVIEEFRSSENTKKIEQYLSGLNNDLEDLDDEEYNEDYEDDDEDDLGTSK